MSILLFDGTLQFKNYNYIVVDVVVGGGGGESGGGGLAVLQFGEGCAQSQSTKYLCFALFSFLIVFLLYLIYIFVDVQF